MADCERRSRLDHDAGHAAPRRADAHFGRMRRCQLTSGESEGSYASRFIPGPQGFRVLVEGKDASGVPFQRVHAPLLSPAR